MKTNVESSTRKVLVAACVVLSAAFVFAPSASLQQGGTFILNPSVVAGGGGTSANGSTNIAGTIGQAVLGLSSGGAFSLNAGFWQAVSPCAVPAITSHPSGQSVCENASVNFSVTVSDTGVTYQWRKNGADITGANSPSLSLNNVSSSDAASYDVVVSKPCGSSATSNPAILTVHIYSLAPDSATFLSSGGTGSFNVNVAGSCPWTAATSDSWIVITSPPGGGGAGNGAVGYSVTANSGTDRTGRIVVAGKNFTVKQEAPTAVTLISFSARSYDNGVFIE
jgi:Putative binding domain, N-terminal